MYKLSLAALLILSLSTSTWAAPTSCSYVLVHDSSRANTYTPQQQCGRAEQAAQIRQPGCASWDNCLSGVSKREVEPNQMDSQNAGSNESGQEATVQTPRYILSTSTSPEAAPGEAKEISEKPSNMPLANEPSDAPSQQSSPVFSPPAPKTTSASSPAPSLSDSNLPSASSASVIPTKSSKKKSKPSPTPRMYKDGLTVTLESAQNFCLFLPSSPGNKDANGGRYDRDAIGSSEKNARTFCTSENLAPGAGRMPTGFIKTAEFRSTDSYVQVNGTINNAAYHLSDQDGGGQYDDHGSGSPPESRCKNYPYYVSLVEPNVNRFCIRCCKSYAQCNAGRSEYGCDAVLRERA